MVVLTNNKKKIGDGIHSLVMDSKETGVIYKVEEAKTIEEKFNILGKYLEEKEIYDHTKRVCFLIRADTKYNLGLDMCKKLLILQITEKNGNGEKVYDFYKKCGLTGFETTCSGFYPEKCIIYKENIKH